MAEALYCALMALSRWKIVRSLAFWLISQKITKSTSSLFRLHFASVGVDFTCQGTWSQLDNVMLTAHSSQLTAHSSQLTAHSSQLTAHSSQLTSSQLTAQSSQLTAQSSKLKAQSSKLATIAEFLSQYYRESTLCHGW